MTRLTSCCTRPCIKFNELDAWLSNGGFMPSDWQYGSEVSALCAPEAHINGYGAASGMTKSGTWVKCSDV